MTLFPIHDPINYWIPLPCFQNPLWEQVPILNFHVGLQCVYPICIKFANFGDCLNFSWIFEDDKMVSIWISPLYLFILPKGSRHQCQMLGIKFWFKIWMTCMWQVGNVSRGECFLYGVVSWEWKTQKLNVLCGNVKQVCNTCLCLCFFL
jgi:hypothetical protein